MTVAEMAGKSSRRPFSLCSRESVKDVMSAGSTFVRPRFSRSPEVAQIAQQSDV
jgi:hypothetical protein